MSKPFLNNKILYNSFYGYVQSLGELISQDVTETASPTFANLQLTGNALIEGNLEVLGNITIIDTDITEFKDNIILLNRSEVANGVTLDQSGLEIDRGNLENYRIVFSEVSGTAKIGTLSNLQPIATREDNPLNDGVAVWNSVNSRFNAVSSLNIPTLYFNSTIDSSNYTTGCLVLYGGLSCNKNVNANSFSLNGTSSTLSHDSNGNFKVGPNGGFKFLNSGDTVSSFIINRTSRSLNLNIPSISEYGGVGNSPNFVFSDNLGNNNIITIRDTISSTNSSSGSVVFYGGIGVNKNIYCKEGINLESSGILTVDGMSIFRQTNGSMSSSDGSVVFSGGVGFSKNIVVQETGVFRNGLNVNNNVISNVADPVLSTDAANKYYVDINRQGLVVKDAVKVATVTAGTLATSFENGDTIDNVVLVTNDRILLKNQTNAVENGIYIVNASGAPSRSADLQIGDSAAGLFVFVQSGQENSSLGLVCNSPPLTDVVGTDPLTFTEFSGGGTINAGIGVSKTLNVLDVNLDGISINTNISNQLQIPNTFAGTGLTGGSGSVFSVTSDLSHVTKLGNIIQGTWSSSVIDVPYGGTGLSKISFGKILIGNSTNGILTSSRLSYDNTTSSLLISSGNTSIGSIILNNSFISSYNDGTSPTLKILSDSNSTNGNFLINSTFQVASSGNIIIRGDLNTHNPIYSINNTPSTNSSSGSITVYGGISIDNTTNSNGYTAGGALTIAGGTTIHKDLYVGSSINATIANLKTLNVSGAGGINLSSGALTISPSSSNSIIANGDVFFNSILNIGSTNSNFASFYSSDGNVFGNFAYYSIYFSNTDGNLYIKNTLGRISLNSIGNFLIGTSVGNSLITMKSNNLISGDSTVSSKYVGFSANEISSSSKIVLYNDGDLSLWTKESVGNFYIKNALNTLVKIDNNGGAIFYNTGSSLNSSTGSLLAYGGISIRETTNSTSITRGGALTIAGGTSIEKDLYIGGNLTINGSLISSTGVTVPNLNVVGNIGCVIVSEYNQKLLNVYGERFLSFSVELYNTIDYSFCNFYFDLPGLSTNIVRRSDIVGFAQGYFNDTSETTLTNVYNVLCTGKIGTTRGCVNFQSNSFNTYNFTIMCRY